MYLCIFSVILQIQVLNAKAKGKKIELLPLTMSFTFFKISVLFLLKKFDILIVCLFGFYGMSTLLGYLMPNPFLYK